MLDIIKEPCDNIYYKLIDLALNISDTVSFTIHNYLSIDDNCIKFLKKLEPYFIKYTKCYYSKDSIVYNYKCSNKLKPIIKKAVNSLYKWSQPSYPEDITFYINDCKFLSSISHESTASIECDNDTEILINKIDGLKILKVDIMELLKNIQVKYNILMEKDYILKRENKKVEFEFLLTKDIISNILKDSNVFINKIILNKYDTVIKLDTISNDEDGISMNFSLSNVFNEKDLSGEFLDTRIFYSNREFKYNNEKFFFFDKNNNILNINYMSSIDLRGIYLTINKEDLINIKDYITIKFNSLNLYTYKKCTKINL